jgi:DNA-binding transcriptional MerR regulator
VRYYEQQRLLTPGRETNGYRSYTEADVDRLNQIVGLVQSGLPTRLVRALMDMQDAVAANHPTCPRTVAEQLASELTGIEDRIRCLSRSRDTIRDYLVRTENEAVLSEARARDTTSGPAFR